MSIATDVERGLEIHAEIKRLKEELKEINARLEAAGLDGEQLELVDDSREGRRYLARGSNHIVSVVFTSDLLLKSFQAHSVAHKRLEEIAGQFLPLFYTFKPTFEAVTDNGKKFRELAAQHLGDKAPTFISACVARDKDGIPKSKTVINWHDATQIT